MLKYKFVPKLESGQRFVIADIHGCAKTFRSLVEYKMKLEKKDQLFLLGDYINRGPDSKGVIDFILELQKEDYQVFALRGNHEQMLLDSHRRNTQTQTPIQAPRLQKRRGLVDDLGCILSEYFSFFDNLPYYFELDDFLLVHAGFNFKSVSPFEDFESMLWLRDFEPDDEYLRRSPKRIIHGHTRYHLQDIQKAVKKRDIVLPLDNGCYEGLRPLGNPFMGNLCALSLDTWELIVQENIDKEVQTKAS